MNYKEQQKQRRAARLKDKFELKSYSQEWSYFSKLVLVFKYTLQVFTAAMFFFLPFIYLHKLFGSFAASAVASAVACVMFELIKHYLATKHAKFSFLPAESDRAKWVAPALFVCISLSILGSFFGTPLAVKLFSPKPIEPQYKEVVASLSFELSNRLSAYDSLVSSAKHQKESIHKANNWRGVTVRKAQPVVLALEAQIAAAKDSISALKSVYEERKSIAWASARRDYNEDVEAHKSEMQMVGWIFAFVCLGLELLFILCVNWLVDYQYHEYCEILDPGGVTLKKIEPLNPRPPTPAKAPQIGFKQEGHIESDGAKNVIYCKPANGELKAYSKSDLTSRISAGGARSEYWKKMKDKLDKYDD